METRLARVQTLLGGAADELVMRGCIGVAARLQFPAVAGGLSVTVASGYRDLEKHHPLDGHELFAIASQSKMFTAALVLLLVRDGSIRLEDPVSRYLPEVPAVDRGATIEQFLNHTSGIGNFIHAMTTLPFPWPQLSFDDIMALARLHGRRFSAGTRFDYNNTDVVVLAKLCEIVTGRSFLSQLHSRLLKPLGLRDTFVASVGAEWPRERMAKGYYQPSQGYDGPPIDVTAVPDFSIASAAGNMISSLSNLCAWMNTLVHPPHAFELGIDDFVASIADSGASGGHWFFPRTYGRGMESWRWGGRRVWGHRGSFFGYHSGTFCEPVSGLIFSVALTTCTQGNFMQFVDVLGHDYMAFMETCCLAGIDALEMP